MSEQIRAGDRLWLTDDSGVTQMIVTSDPEVAADGTVSFHVQPDPSPVSEGVAYWFNWDGEASR